MSDEHIPLYLARKLRLVIHSYIGNSSPPLSDAMDPSRARDGTTDSRNCNDCCNNNDVNKGTGGLANASKRLEIRYLPRAGFWKLWVEVMSESLVALLHDVSP